MRHNHLTLLTQARDNNLLMYVGGILDKQRDLAYCVNQHGQVLKISSSKVDGKLPVIKGYLQVTLPAEDQATGAQEDI